MHPDYVTRKEAAGILGIHPLSFTRAISRGTFSLERFIYRQRRAGRPQHYFLRAEVEALRRKRDEND